MIYVLWRGSGVIELVDATLYLLTKQEVGRLELSQHRRE